MKNFITNKMTVIVAALLMSNTIFAAPVGTRVGNGGVGVRINNQLYMLDLVEYGIQDQPYFGKNKPIAGIKESITDIFSATNLTAIPLDKFVQKISDIMDIDYYMGRTMLEAMKVIDWRLVDSALIRLNDENTVLNPKNLEQVAIRVGLVVYIDRALWAKLDTANKIVLLVHETLFAMANVDEYADIKSQSAQDTRLHTGLFFTKSFVEKGYPENYKNKSFNFSRGPLAPFSKTIFLKGTDQILSYMGLIEMSTEPVPWMSTNVHPKLDSEGNPSFKWNDGTDRDDVSSNYCNTMYKKERSFRFKYESIILKAKRQSYKTSAGSQDRLITASPGDVYRSPIATSTFKSVTDCATKIKQIFEQEAAKAETQFETRKIREL